MREITICGRCKSKNVQYRGHGVVFCFECNCLCVAEDKFVENDHRERLRRQVYATGNRWAIENFNATH